MEVVKDAMGETSLVIRKYDEELADLRESKISSCQETRFYYNKRIEGGDAWGWR